MTGHSVLPPSGASAWGACPGWVAMHRQFPDMDGDPEASREGTAAHAVCASMLQGAPITEGAIEPGTGVVVDEDMIEAASMYAADVLQTCAQFGGVPVVETPVHIPRVHPECWGTPDAWAFDPVQLVLYVWDFKFGHLFVEVFENAQLGPCYASGILDALGFDGHSEQGVRVVCRIVQPRSFHRDGPIREWRFKAADLRPLVNKLRDAALDALGENPTCRVGPQCHYCPGRHACQALQRAALDACDVATTAQPFQLSPSAVGGELRAMRRALALLEARVAGLETEALRLLATGKPVPFWQAVQSKGRERWTVPADQVIALGHAFGVDLAKPLQAITPKQAKALVDESVISAYSETPRGAIKLVPLNDSHAKKVFDQ